MKVELHLGDCLQYMRGMENGNVDCVVTSPPYDNLRTYGGHTWNFEGIAQELFRVVKVGGVVVWVVGDATIDGSETLTSFKQALFFRECGFNVETMIYQIAGTGAKGSNYYYWQSFEYMFIFAKGQPKTSNRIADIKNPNGGNLRGFRTKAAQIGSRVDRSGVRTPFYSVRPNVWRYAVGTNDDTDHPAPFPEALARDHILSWTNEGDTVFDPFTGSGTTGKMAVKLQRNFIGCEIHEPYFRIAEKRIAEAQLQMPLFANNV